MKQLTRQVLLVLIVLCVTCLSATAADETAYYITNGIRYEINLTKVTASVVSLSGDNKYAGDINIPSSVTYKETEYPVTRIAANAFLRCTDLNSVVIPNSVTAVADAAFAQSSIRELIITDGDTEIAFTSSFGDANILSLYIGRNFVNERTYHNFWGIESIADLTIGDYVTSLPASAFGGCTGLKWVKIPDSVTEIGNGVFYNCTGLITVELSNSLTTIPNNTFKGCSSLKTLEIPNSITSIGKNAFDGCTALPSVVYPEFLTTISDSAYKGCTALTSLTFPASLTYIGNEAFSDCSSVTDITITASETPIEFKPDAFDNVDLKKLYLGRNIKRIAMDSQADILYGTFRDKTSLSELKIGNKVTGICTNAFSGCTGLTTIKIPNSVTYIGSDAFSGCSGLTTIKIPSSVTGIGSDAFSGCSGLTSIKIPNSVTYVGKSAFAYCTNVDEFIFEDGETEISVYSSCATGIPFTKLYAGRNGSMFSGDFLTEVTIGDLVTTVRGLRDCKSLRSVKFGESVQTIEAGAFSGCENLSDIVWNNSITQIGEAAFESCVSLPKLDLHSPVQSIGNRAFLGCTDLTTVNFGNGVTSLGTEAFKGCSSLTSINLGNGVSEIGKNTFSGCSSLTFIEIPASVRSIDSRAFYGCEKLDEFSFADSKTSLLFYEDAFNGVTPSKIYLGRNFHFYSHPYGSPFYKLESLSELEFGNAITTIPANAFQACENLTSVTLSNSIETIDNDAFYGCSGITSLNIPASVVSIGSGAFAGCPIASIDCNSIEAPSIDKYTFVSSTRCQVNVNIPEGALKSYEEKWWSFKCFSNISDPSNTITVSSPGNLINQIPLEEIEERISLKLIGKINGTDFLTLNKCSNLNFLDLSEATIVSGGMPYYKDSKETIETVDNTLGKRWGYNMYNLAWVKLPETLTAIADSAFCGKHNLIGDLTIPQSVKTIGNYAFQNCVNLQSIQIPASVSSIGEGAFGYCTDLLEVIVDDSDSELIFRKDVFKNAPITKLYVGRNWNCPYSKYEYPLSISTIKEVTIGNHVTALPVGAFRECSSLETIKIPASITSIGGGAFGFCTSLCKAEFASIEDLCKIKFDALTGNPLSTAHKLYIDGEEIIDLVIPESVTCINDYTFGECSNITSVKLPSNITSIGNSAFINCSRLSSINIPDPVRLIGPEAFAGCSSLTTLNLPGSLREIGSKSFSNCSNLVKINVINPIPPTAPNDAFSLSCYSATLAVPEKSKALYWIDPTWGQFSKIDILTAHAEKSFESGDFRFNITSDDDKTVEITAISPRTRAAEIEIPESANFNNTSYRVTGIANNGLENCSASSVALPKTISYVGLEAFKGCSALQRIECHAIVPPSVHENTFESTTYPNVVLEVHPTANDDYSNHNVWSKFSISSLQISITEITLDPSEITCLKGESFTITPTIYPADATHTELEWSSSDENIATVDQFGHVSVVGFGECVITAKALDGSEIEGTCTVIGRGLIEAIELNPNSWRGQSGDSFIIEATVYPADALNKKLAWSSSDDNVAVVDDEGNVNILRHGTCNIVVKATDGSDIEASCLIDATLSIDQIQFLDDTPFTIFNLSGSVVYTGNEQGIFEKLASGVYIIRTKDSVMKILVK